MNSTSAADRGGRAALVDDGNVLLGAPGTPGCTTTGGAVSLRCARTAREKKTAKTLVAGNARITTLRTKPGWSLHIKRTCLQWSVTGEIFIGRGWNPFHEQEIFIEDEQSRLLRTRTALVVWTYDKVVERSLFRSLPNRKKKSKDETLRTVRFARTRLSSNPRILDLQTARQAGRESTNQKDLRKVTTFSHTIANNSPFQLIRESHSLAVCGQHFVNQTVGSHPIDPSFPVWSEKSCSSNIKSRAHLKVLVVPLVPSENLGFFARWRTNVEKKETFVYRRQQKPAKTP